MFNKSVYLKEFIDICGEDNVSVSPNECDIIQTTTFKTVQTIEGVLHPAKLQEVQECIKVANKYKLKLYPISKGKNIGLGGKVPVQSGCFVLDLSRMNKIIEYNEELAYVRIEAGVTQEQVSNYLASVNSKLFFALVLWASSGLQS